MQNRISRMNEKELAYYTGLVSLATLSKWAFCSRNLYSCNARIYCYTGCYVLQSYNTPIAVFKVVENTLYDFLRTEYGYTATSSQHICKFKKWLTEKGLYNDSTVYVRFIP